MLYNNIIILNIINNYYCYCFTDLQVRQTSKYEDLRELDLPKNLHIQQEYIRFNPEDKEAYHGGRTAYPGRNTIVTSIKYKRKYADIITKKEKPGYINHYYGYW